MRKKRDTGKASLEVDQDFPRFLKQVRKEEKVRLQQLSEGLMTASQLARIEKGERSVCKNLRDRLLGRLGISSDLYENLLNIEDYTAWEQQRNILCAIERKEFLNAQELLAVYEEQEPKADKDKIKQQFCLVMQAEILKQQDANPCEIGSCYEKAVKLTVPDAEHLCIAQKLLCIQEVNMVLEYEFYHRDAVFSKKCKDLMTFVENSAYDDLSKVKIYPKIVYYYLREMSSENCENSASNLGKSLEICNRAIEMLRDTGRAYYLLELLEMKIKIMKSIENDSEEIKIVESIENDSEEFKIVGAIESDSKEYGTIQDREAYRQELRESIEMLDLLKRLYTEYEVPAYMQDCAYLYQQRWVFYVGDVLRIRRKMYGLTQKALCGEDCSVRTLRRAEKKEANMQHEALGILLRRLGLSKEFQRARLVSNDREVLKLREEFAVCRNNYELERARKILSQIRTRVSDKIPENRQYFEEVEASLNWMEGKITKEEFAKREVEALQCTLKVKDLYQMNKVYLTQMEMSCIRKLIQVLTDTEKRKYIDFLLHFFEYYEKKNALSDCISMYEFATIRVVCELGNLEEYQSATILAKKVLREDLICKRLWGIDGYLYEISWNEREKYAKNGKLIESEKMTETINQCIILSHFCKQTFYESFYRKKIYHV